MGMFDSIKVKAKLPLPTEVEHLDIKWDEVEFQTKAFDNCLIQYIIEENGDLYEEEVVREYIPWTKEERKVKNITPWSLWKDVIEKSRTLKKIDYHGIVPFYCYEDLDAQTNFSLDFKAYYTYGKLDKIQFEGFNTYEANKDQLKELMRAENTFIKRFARKVKKYTGWNWCFKKIIRILQLCINAAELVKKYIYRYLL